VPKRRFSYTYLIEEFIPLREAGVSQGAIDTMTKENPRRYFAGRGLRQEQQKPVIRDPCRRLAIYLMAGWVGYEKSA
jgi:hypothetical protein